MKRHKSLENLSTEDASSASARRLRKLWKKYRRVTMSDMHSIKMAENEHNQRQENHKDSIVNHVNYHLQRSNSVGSENNYKWTESKLGDGQKKEEPKLDRRNVHRNSWPAIHNEPISPRGPMKSHIGRMKEELQDIAEIPTSPRSTASAGTENEQDYDGFPDPEQQCRIITNLDTECTCTYAVSKLWYGKWEEYCGVPKGSTPGASEKPGPLEMDTHNDANNEYISEQVWKRLVKWYGVSPNHQLDRKHLYFKDEKMFDVCILSPFSGIVEHNVKKFNRFEEIGYIECQLRRIFHVPDYKKSRLWISEKAQVPRFRQLLLRFRMLNDCIHRDKVYILALEECNGTTGWPTGEPGEPKGDLSKYKDIISGPVTDDYWDQEIKQSLNSIQSSISDMARQAMESFLQTSKSILMEKESALNHSTKLLEYKLEDAKSKEKLLAEQEREVAHTEEKLNKQREELEKKCAEFEERKRAFDEELKHMESLHQVQETKIKLDVGGQVYTTSIQTLRRDPNSMLAAMFSGRYELKKESDGSYFIDRDGTFFRYILNFLRDGCLEAGTLPSDSVIIKELHREAKYYQLAELVHYLEELLQTIQTGNEK